jgi:hypothetical protein
MLVRRKSRTVNWKPAILRLWKRREAKLAFLGLGLVAITQWSFLRMNLEGTVTLEFVEIVTNGRGMEEGTLAKFRLRNESGEEISYYGIKAQEPYCEVRPAGENTRAEGRPVYESPYLDMGRQDGGWFPDERPVLPANEEVIVYVRVWHANGPWRMVMDYTLDGGNQWREYVPVRFHHWLPSQSTMRRGMQVASDPVAIKVRGLDFKQRYVLAQYRQITNSTALPVLRTMVVTNMDGSFGVKQVAR